MSDSEEQWYQLELMSPNPSNHAVKRFSVRMEGDNAVDRGGVVVAGKDNSGRWHIMGSPYVGKLTPIPK